MNTTKEKIKSVLIGVLIVGMLYLTYAVWFYDSPFGELRFDSVFDIGNSFEVSEGAGSDLDRFGIRPLAIAVSDDSGRRGAIYKSERSDDIYTILREEISQIMKKMKEPSVCDSAEWETALISQGVFMDFRSDIPVSALRLWLSGFSDDKSLCGRYYIFSTDKRNVKIYIKNSLDGNVYVAETEGSSENLREAMKYVKSEKVNFAALRTEEDFRAISPETLLSESDVSLPVLLAYSPDVSITDTVEASCLGIFGLSDVPTTKYAEQDGADVYVADRITLKISPDGTVVYTDTREEADKTLGITVESEGDFPTLAEKTEKARQLAAALASNTPGAGGIYLASVSEGAGGTEIVFGRHVAGTPVDIRDSMYFVSITVKGKSVRSVRARLMGYELTERIAPLVPEKIAAAAVRGSGKTGEMNIRYRDEGEREVSPAWYIGGIKKQGEGEE